MWVLPPGPDWWQNRISRISIDFESFRVADDAFEENLCSSFYSAAVQEASHGISQNFTPPPFDAQPHIILQVHGGEVQPVWLHPWFRMYPLSHPAVALCPSVLTLFRLQFESAPHRHAEPMLMWPCFGTLHHLLLF
jgi:hypothetical protein